MHPEHRQFGFVSDVDILRFLRKLGRESMDEALLGTLPKMLAHEVLKET